MPTLPTALQRRASSPLGATEAELFARGAAEVVGVDEAGAGALAGPITAAAVAIPRGWHPPQGLNDSKKLTPRRRRALYEELVADSRLRIGIAWGSASRIDQEGIRPTNLAVMAEAVARVGGDSPVVVDAWTIDVEGRDQYPLVRGDSRSVAIAAASVIAKVSRDLHMVALADLYPQWGFDIHKGYGTAAHRAAIATEGLSEAHRRTFCRNAVAA